MIRTAVCSLLLLASTTVFSASLPKGLLEQDGRPAPALRLATMEGKTTDIAALRGQWVLVHFWASWCVPCRREMPTLQGLAAVTPPLPVKLLLVNTAETDDEVFAFLNIIAPDLETLMDRDGQVTERWQPRGLPASFLVDPAGRIRYLALGGRDWLSPDYQAFLRSLAVSAGRSPDVPRINPN
ncbi:MAG: TlpA family protein disulfide reductase [Gammaproteobacteria bacterium]|nr:TlpA family protein disulfide reductase [Gammaproteobacteria bacterium]